MRDNIIEYQIGEGSPLQLRLGPDQKQDVPLAARWTGVVKVVLRPRYSALRVVDDPNLRTRLGEDEEIFGIDLRARLGVPLPHQKAQCTGRDFGGVVPAGKRRQYDRIAKIGAIQFKQLIQGRSPSSARSSVEYATASAS
jgi:hypothetical protein